MSARAVVVPRAAADDFRSWQETVHLLRSPVDAARLMAAVAEPLKGELSGHWSRRIDDEHRLVYRATEKEIVIIKARYHY